MKKEAPAQPLLVGDVAKRLDVSTTRVTQLDAELQPERTPDGTRVYRADAVEQFAAHREARRTKGPR